MSIGQRIKQRRKDLNISADELARKLGKNRATVYRYEKDDIKDLPISVLESLADVLGTTPAYLMGWTDSNQDYQDETFEHYLNSIGILCERIIIDDDIWHKRTKDYDGYYEIKISGEEYKLSLDNYKKLNENVLSLVMEYSKSNSDHVNTLLTNYLKLSDVGKAKILDNIKDLAILYPKFNSNPKK